MKLFLPGRAILLIILAAISAIFAFEVNSKPSLYTFNPKRVGSFEYIRMGEKFLDKNLYTNAIDCYEKAHESSPQNPTIISDIIFVYSKYASVLADSGKYDEAIEYLIRAYNVKQDSATMQNLAIMYTRKALMLVQKGESQKAPALIRDARRIAGGSYIAAKNLGIALFNDAVTEFKKGREDTALMCLKESSLTYQYGKTFALIGDIYYKVGNLKRARFYWHRAKILGSDDVSVSHKLKRMSHEMRLANFQQDMELPHFDVKYEGGLSIDAALASETLEKAYSEIGKDLGYFPKTKTGVFLYSKDDFSNIFKMSSAVRAFYDGNIRMPVPGGRLGEKEFLRHIYHEYTHALLSAKTMNNCPVWLSEGIAMWEELDKSGKSINSLLVMAHGIDDITLDSLDKEFESNEITSKRTAYYIFSYTLAAYIIDSWGIKGLQGILKRLSLGQHVVNAIDDEFLLPEKEFESRWKTYVKNKYFKNISQNNP